jgi:hypothetical protein
VVGAAAGGVGLFEGHVAVLAGLDRRHEPTALEPGSYEAPGVDAVVGRRHRVGQPSHLVDGADQKEVADREGADRVRQAGEGEEPRLVG